MGLSSLSVLHNGFTTILLQSRVLVYLNYEKCRLTAWRGQLPLNAVMRTSQVLTRFILITTL